MSRLDDEGLGMDLAKLQYSLDMMPQWVELLEKGELSVSGTVNALRQDLASAIAAFRRLRDAVEASDIDLSEPADYVKPPPFEEDLHDQIPF